MGFHKRKNSIQLRVITGGVRGMYSLRQWFPSVLQLAKDSGVLPGHVLFMVPFSLFCGRQGGGGRGERLSGDTKEKD